MGGLAAIGFTLVADLTGPRRRKIQVPLDVSALPALDAFLISLASRRGWTEAGQQRLRAVAEETLLSLVPENESPQASRQFVMSIRLDGATAEIEFIAASDGDNIEDRMAYLSDDPYASNEREFSIRLLRHYASSVEHRKYEGVDIITVRVES